MEEQQQLELTMARYWLLAIKTYVSMGSRPLASPDEYRIVAYGVRDRVELNMLDDTPATRIYNMAGLIWIHYYYPDAPKFQMRYPGIPITSLPKVLQSLQPEDSPRQDPSQPSQPQSIHGPQPLRLNTVDVDEINISAPSNHMNNLGVEVAGTMSNPVAWCLNCTGKQPTNQCIKPCQWPRCRNRHHSPDCPYQQLLLTR
ncbi:hypothetical protein NHQ30_000456 [Ciborinia camelliae]|nr:hypothetical protein NHQ30_000456 [Ciborinia camelliae]